MPIKKIEKETLDKFKAGWKKNPRTGLWYTYEVDYQDPHSGRRKRQRGFHSEGEAAKFLHDLEVSAEMRRLGLVAPSRTLPEIREVLQRRLGDIANRRARVRATTTFRLFLGTLPDGFTCDQLRAKQYKDYADMRLRAGVKPETVNREAAFIMSALKSAHLNFPSLEDWTPPKGFYAKSDKRKKRERVITKEEERKIVEWLMRPQQKGETRLASVARLRAALIFEFALMTGLRHGEIVGIRKSEVGEKELPVWRSKTKVWTTFPMTAEMRAIIDRASELSAGEFVFSTKGIVQGKTWHKLREACEAVGVPWGKDGGIVLHTARHTFITRLLQAGVDIATIQSFSSHSDKEMVMRYSHASEATRKRALGALRERERDQLAEIWNRVKNGNMGLEEFIDVIGKF